MTKTLQIYDILGMTEPWKCLREAHSGCWLVYHVARLRYGADDCWLVRFLFYLMSEAADPGPQYLYVITIFWPPDPCQQFAIQHKLARISGKLAQQKPLDSGQLYFFFVHDNEMLLEINGHMS